jgi:AcrR family transcriptional regulator
VKSKGPSKRAAARRPRAVRSYRQTARAEQAHATHRRIVDATIAAVHDTPRLRDITLEQVADRADVTVRTILRRFGSRDALLQAAFVEIMEGMHDSRPLTAPDDVEAAVASIVGQYERIGDLNVKMLEQEHDLPLVAELMQRGRREHRGWLEEVFAPSLEPLDRAAREQRVLELYAATDVYLWKLFRRDLRLGVPQITEAFRTLLSGVLGRRERHASRGGNR